MLKKALFFVAVVAMVFSLASCGSSGSDAEKVFTLRSCSFALPSSWTDNSAGDSLMYTAPDDSAGLNVSADGSENRTALADRLADVGYDLETLTVAGDDVRLFVYQQDGFWFRDFEAERPDAVYHFVYMSEAEDPDGFDQFVQSIKFS